MVMTRDEIRARCEGAKRNTVWLVASDVLGLLDDLEAAEADVLDVLYRVDEAQEALAL